MNALSKMDPYLKEVLKVNTYEEKIKIQYLFTIKETKGIG